MTALNVFIEGTSAHLITDGLAHLPDGTTAVVNKVGLLPNLPAAFAIRGTAFFIHSLRGALEGFADFDALVRGVVQRTKDAADQCAPLFEQSAFGRNFELALIGYSSSRGRPQAFTLANFPNHGAPAWTLVPIDDGLISPGDGSFFERLQVRGLLPCEDSFDVGRDGLEIMRLQRGITAETPPGSGRVAPVIGALAQLVSVSRDRVETRVLERWI